jgi:hypothetical protein
MELLQQKLGGAANVTPEAMRNLLMQQVRAQNEQGAARPFPDLITDEPRPNPVATPTVQRTSTAPGARMPTPPIPPGTPAPQTTTLPTPPIPPATAPSVGQQVVSGAPAVPPTTSAAPPAATTVTPAPSATSTEPTLDLNVTGREPVDMTAMVDKAVAPATVPTATVPTPPPVSSTGDVITDPTNASRVPPTSKAGPLGSGATRPTAASTQQEIAQIWQRIQNIDPKLAAALIGGAITQGYMPPNLVSTPDPNAPAEPKPGPRANKGADTTKGPPSTPDSGAKSGPRVAKATTPPASRGTMNDTFTFNEPTVGGNILRGQPVQEPPVSEPKPAPRARTNSPKSAVPTSKAAQAANPTKFPPIPKSAVVPVDIPPARPTPRTVTPTPAPPPPVEAPIQSPASLRGGTGPLPAHDPSIQQLVNDTLAQSPRPSGAIGGVHRAPIPAAISRLLSGMNAGIPFVGGIDPSKSALENALATARQFNLVPRNK